MDRLDLLAKEIVDHGYRGDLQVVASRTEIPESFYESTLIVGATNVPEVLEISRLRPGTLIVDDSAPHCFNVEAGYARLKRDKDVLFTEGGQLEAPFALDRLSYINRELPTDTQEAFRAITPLGARNSGGCVMSSLLVERFHGYEPAIGEIDVSRCWQAFGLLSKIGFTAAEPLCHPYVIPSELISRFVDHCDSNGRRRRR